jgi:hypothetical protein
MRFKFFNAQAGLGGSLSHAAEEFKEGGTYRFAAIHPRIGKQASNNESGRFSGRPRCPLMHDCGPQMLYGLVARLAILEQQRTQMARRIRSAP